MRKLVDWLNSLAPQWACTMDKWCRIGSVTMLLIAIAILLLRLLSKAPQ